MNFDCGRKLWTLNGKVVTEQEVKGLYEADLREALEFRDKMWNSYEAEQIP